MSAIFERISIRKYEKKSVSDEMIKKIIEAGCAAPSAGNQQPWQFYVVKNNEILEKLSHVHQWAGPVAEADFAIVPCYKNEDFGLRNLHMLIWPHARKICCLRLRSSVLAQYG